MKRTMLFLLFSRQNFMSNKLQGKLNSKKTESREKRCYKVATYILQDCIRDYKTWVVLLQFIPLHISFIPLSFCSSSYLFIFIFFLLLLSYPELSSFIISNFPSWLCLNIFGALHCPQLSLSSAHLVCCLSLSSSLFFVLKFLRRSTSVHDVFKHCTRLFLSSQGQNSRKHANSLPFIPKWQFLFSNVWPDVERRKITFKLLLTLHTILRTISDSLSVQKGGLTNFTLSTMLIWA